MIYSRYIWGAKESKGFVQYVQKTSSKYIATSASSMLLPSTSATVPLCTKYTSFQEEGGNFEESCSIIYSVNVCTKICKAEWTGLYSICAEYCKRRIVQYLHTLMSTGSVLSAESCSNYTANVPKTCAVHKDNVKPQHQESLAVDGFLQLRHSRFYLFDTQETYCVQAVTDSYCLTDRRRLHPHSTISSSSTFKTKALAIGGQNRRVGRKQPAMKTEKVAWMGMIQHSTWYRYLVITDYFEVQGSGNHHFTKVPLDGIFPPNKVNYREFQNDTQKQNKNYSMSCTGAALYLMTLSTLPIRDGCVSQIRQTHT